jgi:hypothetical protein
MSEDNPGRLERYDKLNRSFDRKLVFRFGDGAGFFSEFNNMVLAMIYCLDNRIQFTLYTPPDGTLAVEKGWNDYFQPFCEQTTAAFHKVHNERFLLQQPSCWQNAVRAFWKWKEGFDFFTYELWDGFRSQRFIGKTFDFPELSIRGGLLASTSQLIEMIWRYSDKIQPSIHRRIQALGLPEEYVGLHVRGGDKVTEAKVFSPDDYMALVKNSTDLRDVFVLTDEYRHFLYLQDRYPGYRFYTTCGPHEAGYDFPSFLKLDKPTQFDEYAKLLASMEVLSKAVLTFGSYKANPGMFLGMRIGKKFIGIDSDQWLVMS